MGKQKEIVTVLIIAIATIAALFAPIPERSLTSTFCNAKYPDADCYSSYEWVLGPSLFTRLTSEKYNPPPPDYINTPEGKTCGGFAGETGEFKCPDNYRCEYPKPMNPDARGVCVKEL